MTWQVKLNLNEKKVPKVRNECYHNDNNYTSQPLIPKLGLSVELA